MRTGQDLRGCGEDPAISMSYCGVFISLEIVFALRRHFCPTSTMLTNDRTGTTVSNYFIPTPNIWSWQGFFENMSLSCPDCLQNLNYYVEPPW